MIRLKYLLTAYLLCEVCLSTVIELEECQDNVDLELTAKFDADLYRIVSPNYPDYYPKDILCGFRIKAPREDLTVILIIDVSSIGNQGFCGEDSLTVYDGPSNKSVLLGRHCHNTGTHESTNEYLYVQFSSKSKTNLRGFGFSARYYSTNDQFVSKDSDKSYIGGIIGGICAVFTVIVVMVIICHRHRLKRCFSDQTNPPTERNRPSPNIVGYSSNPSILPANYDPPAYTPKDPQDYSYEPPPSYEEVMSNTRA